MSALEERHQRLWHSGHDSSELDIVTNPAKLRAQAIAADRERLDAEEAERRARQDREETERRERREQQRYARYIATVGRAFDKPYVTVAAVQRAVAAHFGISRVELLSDCRMQSIVRPRQIAMYLAKIFTGKSLADIGRRFANRDHTTVIHAVNRVTVDMAADPDLAAAVAAMRRTIEGQRL